MPHLAKDSTADIISDKLALLLLPYDISDIGNIARNRFSFLCREQQPRHLLGFQQLRRN